MAILSCTKCQNTSKVNVSAELNHLLSKIGLSHIEFTKKISLRSTNEASRFICAQFQFSIVINGHHTGKPNTPYVCVVLESESQFKPAALLWSKVFEIRAKCETSALGDHKMEWNAKKAKDIIFMLYYSLQQSQFSVSFTIQLGVFALTAI